jgi:hypothetical protein
MSPHPEERALARVSKDERPSILFGPPWFETALKKRLLTTRNRKRKSFA